MGIDGEREDDRRDVISVEFSRSAAKLAVGQVCESIGYDQFRDPALESLTDLAVQYVLLLGKAATSFANLTGRNQCNVFDIVLALEDLSGGSDGERFSSGGNCVAHSVKLREIVDYVNSSEEVPFVQPLPRFPVIVSDSSKMIPSFVQMGEDPPGKHIPLWLPAFPDPHTYKETPMWVERASDPRGDKIKQSKQRRKAESALLSLQQKLVSKMSSASPMWGDMDGVKEDFRKDESKLQTASVSEAGERDDINGLSVVEAFAPAIKAAKDEHCGEVDAERKKKKPPVLFKIGTGKKLLGQPLDLSLQKKGEERPMSFVRDEDRDDKRRRAEFIIRQCMENPVDLNQL
ncbi:PREDICTED: transcription initiation factor TFIID subunit 8 [Tarenaya hassleriana]|uniref:transcription initiation factor TFIID subunit 8 n=1 Tax=Tarenaya hassleriana TaxID=28532 RepID=UPI00053C6316|nr:PREDICTED: transcription initiation factor TFIID subunit 8 [Tarenaya hassleriana]